LKIHLNPIRGRLLSGVTTKQRDQPDMTTQDSSYTVERNIRTKAFQATYLLAAAVATIGWTWMLGYVALALLGY
jgi:hypothetical protein